MNTFKFDAFVTEFPFLAECLVRSDGTPRNAKTCDGIKVKRITTDVLGQTPRTYEWDGSLVGISEWEQVDFITDNGIIKDAVKDCGTSGSNYAHSSTHEWEGESVLEAINRHGVAESLKFIVWVSFGYNVENHHSQSNWMVVVYKPAKDFALAEAIAQAKAEAMAEVQAEASF